MEPENNLKEASETCKAVMDQDLLLLQKLEEENRRLQSDAKSLSVLTHSRKASDASLKSADFTATATNSVMDDNIKNLGEEVLWKTWSSLVVNWKQDYKKRNLYVKSLIRQGIPHHFRAIVWKLLADEAADDSKLYSKYIKSQSACEKVIRRDIARTYPEHEFFKEKGGPGQESLFNVMKAYSLHDREVGYCQGSGFIVGLLLMLMPEEEAFQVLIYIMKQHRMRDMFKPTMAELGLCIFQLEDLVKQYFPEIHMHFKSQNFSTSIYASSWFLTIFTTMLSTSVACRIMDVFLAEGVDIVFQISLALLTIGKEDLLILDMENLLKYVQKELPAKVESDPDGMMELAYSIKLNPKKMRRLAKEYTIIKSKELEDVATIRCLKQENRLLRQRVELLESESYNLAERLVKGQVDKAENEEETFALGREVLALRRLYMDVQQRLSIAQDENRSLEMTLAEKNSKQSSLESSEGLEGSELARCLQRELVRARLQAAEKEAAERELTLRITELENENKNLRKQSVDNNVAHLQDELISVKVREAETTLALKELRQRIEEVSTNWAQYMQARQEATQLSATPAATNMVSDLMATPKKLLRALEGRSPELQKLDEELMTTKIKEVEAITELKELRLKLIQLEMQIQVSANQLKRQDDEMQHLKEDLENALQHERVLQLQIRDAQHKYTDLENTAKYDSMQASIRNMEDAQRIAELENEISEYKMKSEVLATEDQLRTKIDDSEQVRDLQEKIEELQIQFPTPVTSPASEPWKWLEFQC